jgi:hypothetical protein
LIATMVGIVGILLLGSLAWSAVGALFSAVGEATGSLTGGRPAPVRLTAVAVGPAATATPRPAVAPTLATAAPTPTLATAAPTPTPAPQARLSPTPAPSPSPAPQAQASPTPAPQAQASPTPAPADGRAPWILLPQPAPGGKVQAGQTTIEARGRGDAPIANMRLELDGAALSGTLEQRSDSVWRIAASTKVGPGQHNVRATITDDQGRTGGYRWSFEAAP